MILLGATSAAPLHAIDTRVRSTRAFHVNDIDITCQELGVGDPILMIMGYGGSMDLWSPRLLELLSASHRVIVFDNRGMGRTTSTEKPYSIRLFAEDSLGLMDALHLERATVLGWFMGAEVALEMAISAPRRVSRLVLIAGTPGGKDQVPPTDEVMRKFLDESGSSLERGLRLIGLLFPQSWLKDHPFFPSYFPVTATMNPPERSRRQLAAIQEWEGCGPRLGQIEAPALIITGDEDVIVPPENAAILAEGIHDSRLLRFPRGGHGVMYQYTDRIADEIAAFMRNTPEGRK